MMHENAGFFDIPLFGIMPKKIITIIFRRFLAEIRLRYISNKSNKNSDF